MDECFTNEPASSDAEALANLVAVFKQLEGHPVLRIGQQLIDSNSEEDLLQNIMVAILDAEKWKQIRSKLGLYWYVKRAMRNELINLCERAKKGDSFDPAEVDFQLPGLLEASPDQTFELDREDKALIEWLKRIPMTVKSTEFAIIHSKVRRVQTLCLFKLLTFWRTNLIATSTIVSSKESRLTRASL